MSFNEFIHKYNLRNKVTSNKKIQQSLPFLSLNDVGIFLTVGFFSSDVGIDNLHPSKGAHWVAYKNGICFVSYGCAPAQKLSKFNIKRN